jgi:hypothetical protein
MATPTQATTQSASSPSSTILASPNANAYSWGRVAKQRRVLKVVLFVLAIVVIGIVLLTGFVLYPKCNMTQVHGFFTCNCPANAIYNPATSECVCADTGGGEVAACDSDAVRFLYAQEPDIVFQ